MARLSARARRLCVGVVVLLVGLGSASGAARAEAELPAGKIIVATKVFKPFAFREDDRWVGFSVELWDAIAQELGVEYEWLGTGSVAELLGAVRDGRAQMATAGITITREREQSVDFSFPFFESGLQVMAPETGSGGSIFGSALLPLLLRIIGVGVLVILVVAHAAWLVERKRNPEMFSASYLSGIWDAFWWAAVTLTTVGYGDRIPRSHVGRILAMVWMFSGLILVSIFTATITTQLTVQHLEGNIRGPEDLPGKRVGTVKGSTAAKWLYGSAVKVEEFPRVEEACEALEDGRLDAVVYDSPALLYYASHQGGGRVQVVGPVFERQSYGIALADKSPYYERVNQALLAIRENGVYATLYRKWFGS